MHEKVFEASGHLKNFIDPEVRCSKCDFVERADHFLEKQVHLKVEGSSAEELTALIRKHKLSCPKCTSALKPVAIVNMMFALPMGTESRQRAFLRPETAQSPYVNFKLQYELQRKKMPLGLALIGRAYRNEISPRNLTLRQREFTQAELQIFFNPAFVGMHKDFPAIKEYKLQALLVEDRSHHHVHERTAEELVQRGLPQFYVYHLVKIQQFYLEELKIPAEKFRFYELNDKEKAFYNKYHFDMEIELQEHGFTEVGGLHYRTDHDLKGHQAVSKESMEILDEPSGKKFIPHVLELSFGVDRNVYALLDLNYDNNAERGNIILHLPAIITPFFCAVFPLVKNKPEVVGKAEEVYSLLKKEFSCLYDEAASVGRRYARADEIGVRYCLTVDFDSLDDNCVTIRDRETTQQERVSISRLVQRLMELRA
ncbi:glycine--tRNA ligase [Candidatus Woesearchaeota archaeon]|nr:glycine--tRNA ligase [Candidatus Woesearchaeota archaeon]